MEERDDASGESNEGIISQRDAEVVRVINEEGLSEFTFDGLRRMTGVHPETLSRTLERLEEDGIVMRSPDGYTLTSKPKGATTLRPAASEGKRVPILHTFLPFGISAKMITPALKGRWFDRMRWVGVSECDDGLVLKWVIDGSSAVVEARIASGQLDIEARVKKEEDIHIAVRAAHQLMARISRFYSSQRFGGIATILTSNFTPFGM